MIIKSKRHPDRRIKHAVLPILQDRQFMSLTNNFWKPDADNVISEAMAYADENVNAIEIQQYVDMVQRGIIAHNQLYEQLLSAERVNRMVEAMTAQLVVPTPNILK